VYPLIEADQSLPPVSLIGSPLDHLLTPVINQYGITMGYAWKDNPEMTDMLLSFNEIPSC
jgi:hypothetical protein